jgi:hypothetical protein
MDIYKKVQGLEHTLKHMKRVMHTKNDNSTVCDSFSDFDLEEMLGKQSLLEDDISLPTFVVS